MARATTRSLRVSRAMPPTRCPDASSVSVSPLNASALRLSTPPGLSPVSFPSFTTEMPFPKSIPRQLSMNQQESPARANTRMPIPIFSPLIA